MWRRDTQDGPTGRPGGEMAGCLGGGSAVDLAPKAPPKSRHQGLRENSVQSKSNHCIVRIMRKKLQNYILICMNRTGPRGGARATWASEGRGLAGSLGRLGRAPAAAQPSPLPLERCSGRMEGSRARRGRLALQLELSAACRAVPRPLWLLPGSDCLAQGGALGSDTVRTGHGLGERTPPAQFPAHAHPVSVRGVLSAGLPQERNRAGGIQFGGLPILPHSMGSSEWG